MAGMGRARARGAARSATVIETRFPIRVERHELLPKMAGAGRFRAGAGVARDFRMLEGGIRMQFTVENVRDTLAKGLGGGRDGEPGYLVASPGTSREEMLRERVTYWGPLAAGDVIGVRSGGGGGWGNPREREPSQVAVDLRNGYLTRDVAKELYGVSIRRDGVLDEADTQRLRAAP
jgi:N-methylhydantoinase B